MRFSDCLVPVTDLAAAPLNVTYRIQVSNNATVLEHNKVVMPCPHVRRTSAVDSSSRV